MVVFGDTSFSDFSLAPHFVHDNEHFIPVLTEWVLFDNLAGGIVYNPQIKAILSGTEFTNPFTI